MTQGEAVGKEVFVTRLLSAVPETGPVVDEHLGDQDGELLLHLLMADLLRFAVRLFQDEEVDSLAKLLGFIERCLRAGDDDVENAVAVSFVENVGGKWGETPEFIASWPAGLRDERDRQIDWDNRRK